MTRIPDFNFIFSDDNSILKPIGWPKLKKKIDKLLERNERLIAKFNSEKLRSIAKVQSEELTSFNNSRNIPTNATVRRSTLGVERKIVWPNMGLITLPIERIITAS